jgi:VanZ family protein
MKKVAKLIFVAYTLFIIVMAVIPSAPVTTGSDKLNHWLAFFLWAILLRYSFKESYWGIFFYSVFFGAFIEILQYFLPYRTAEYGDFVADIFGALCGMFIYFAYEFGVNILKEHGEEGEL